MFPRIQQQCRFRAGRRRIRGIATRSGFRLITAPAATACMRRGSSAILRQPRGRRVDAARYGRDAVPVRAHRAKLLPRHAERQQLGRLSPALRYEKRPTRYFPSLFYSVTSPRCRGIPSFRQNWAEFVRFVQPKFGMPLGVGDPPPEGAGAAGPRAACVTHLVTLLSRREGALAAPYSCAPP